MNLPVTTARHVLNWLADLAVPPALFDVFAAVGLVLLGAGVAMIHWPTSVCIVGFFLLALGLALAKQHARGEREPRTKSAAQSKAKNGSRLRDVGARIVHDGKRETLAPNDYTLDRGAIVPEDE
jgi:hypothetical protein